MALKKISKNKITKDTKKVEKEERANMVNPLDERQALKKQAEENTTVVKKSSGIEETIKSGTPNDHSNKHKANVVGLAKGITKNMENYESFRADCWLSVQVEEGTDINKVLDELSDIIDDRLATEVEKVCQ